MTKQEAIKKSVEHYDRMIKWASEENSNENVDKDSMIDAIGEVWNSFYCDLCQKYIYTGCINCPLRIKYGACDVDVDEVVNINNWHNLKETKIWQTWLIKAKKMRSQLKSLLRK